MIYHSVEIFPWYSCYLLFFFGLSEVSALTMQDISIKESHLTDIRVQIICLSH